MLPTLKLSTQHSYGVLLKKHLIPYFGDFRLCDITRQEVQKFIVEKSKQDLAWQAVRNTWIVLPSILDSAVQYEYLTTNAARGVRFPAKPPAKSPKILTIESLEKLLLHLSEPYLLQHVLQPAGEAAGIGRVTWHQFRHIHTSQLHNMGVPAKIAQKQLGHSSAETTFRVYTHVVENAHRKAICDLERLLFPNVPKFEESRNSRGFVN